MLRANLGHLAALFAMIVLSAAVSLYVAVHERLRFPWQEETRIYAEFENAQSVTPGQGQTVDVAGVEVGEIGGGVAGFFGREPSSGCCTSPTSGSLSPETWPVVIVWLPKPA